MRKHLPFIIFFILFILTGVTIFDDYGVSWDEAECRIDNGILNTRFIQSGDSKPLLESISKYHGASYEMFLYSLERVAGLKSTHEIFLMRHLVTFLLFALSVFFFYLIGLKIFRSKWYALTACLFYVLCPRIFADAFYNPKDLPFLSLLVISLFTLVVFIERKSIASAFIAATVAGIMTDIRIMGMLLPAFTLLYLSIEFLKHKKDRRAIIVSTSFYSAFLVGSIILFWPVLWLDPVKHFILAWNELSKYPWPGTVLYNGIIFPATQLPWHYAFVWMLITIPVLYIALFLVGFFILLQKIFLKSPLNHIEWFSLYLVIVPIASVLALGSVLYDGWRHLFFIYPSIVLIAVTGLKSLMNLLNEKRRNYLTAGVTTYLTFIIITMVELHPFQYVYFNFLAELSEKSIRERFEIDYWGLSYKQAFEHILKKDSSENIIVYLAEGQPGIDNMQFLKQEHRNRITVTDIPELACYYLTCHRYGRSIKNFENVFRITKNHTIIHSIYDLRDLRIVLDSANQVASFRNTYDGMQEGFHPAKVVTDTTGENINYFELVTAETEFAGGFSVHPPPELTLQSPMKKYMSANIKMYSSKPVKTLMIFQIDSAKTYFWRKYTIDNSGVNKWNRYNYFCMVPDIGSQQDILKVHLMNFEKKEFMLDEFSIRFYSVDSTLVNDIRAKLPI